MRNRWLGIVAGTLVGTTFPGGVRAHIAAPAARPQPVAAPVASVPRLPAVWEAAAISAWRLCRTTTGSGAAAVALRIDFTYSGLQVQAYAPNLETRQEQPINACLRRRLSLLGTQNVAGHRTVFLVLPARLWSGMPLHMRSASAVSAQSGQATWNVPLRRAAATSPGT